MKMHPPPCIHINKNGFGFCMLESHNVKHFFGLLTMRTKCDIVVGSITCRDMVFGDPGLRLPPPPAKPRIRSRTFTDGDGI